jgi:hypothetical protein
MLVINHSETINDGKKRKFKQWWSSIPTTKRTIISHLN